MIAALLPIIGSVLDKVIPDTAAREQAKSDMEKALVENANAINLAILEVNKAEAQHRSLFVAGWRPFVGWSCGIAFFWHFVGAPIATFILAYAGIDAPPLPTFDMGSLLTVLMGMLGLGGLRTFEKLKNLTK